ncbi:MAG: type II CAAX endopeptidase family protein [Elusimicrobia bacterium]|nr:type II CAAX endopeptidase family protein [Elusimicrobiota bacterium]
MNILFIVFYLVFIAIVISSFLKFIKELKKQELSEVGVAAPWNLMMTLRIVLILFAIELAIYITGRYGYFKIFGKNSYFDHINLFVTYIVQGPLLIYIMKIRKSFSIREYIGLKIPTKKESLKWSLTFGIIIAVFYIIEIIIKRPFASQYLVDLYKTSRSPLLLFIVVVIMAPIYEEIVFRGFLFEGIRYSRLKIVGAIIITSLIWASLHLQYGLYEIVTIFLMGLLFGFCRFKTGSIYLTIFLHMLVNLEAMVEVILKAVS